MKNIPDKIQGIVPEHIEYWTSLEIQDMSHGPFSDRSGGLIIFPAENKIEAEKIVSQDPFVIHDLLSEKWIKEWMAE